MVETAPDACHTFAEYLALEAKSETKYEFVNGEILVMERGTLEHSLVCANVISKIYNAIAGCHCIVLGSNVRLRVLETGLATYADVSVVCTRIEHDPENEDTIVNPTVIVEVLSPGTVPHDSNEMWAHYRRIPSLRDYLLVSQHERRIEHYRRNEDGTWTLRDVRSGQEVKLDSIGCAFSMDTVYRSPLLDPPRAATRPGA